MAVCQPAYEDFRRQRLEENKKRMEDLNLTMLSQTLRNASPKPSPVKSGKPRVVRKEAGLVKVRRSSRVANKPAPIYKEAVVEYVERPRSYKRRSLLNRVYASDEARSYAIEKANEVQSNLEPEFPSFVKPMLQSHVTGGFWLGLPVQFSKLNLPRHDATVTLVDENGDEYPTVYLAQKTGLSGGWRGFSLAHDLVDGDALVFQLVKATIFKVFIIRASGLESEDDLDVGPKRINAGTFNGLVCHPFHGY
ncbi:B3 domain-containing protein Os06g0194400-like [Magnolia sinica]|uniref:B3 domain-containing protein Os06g0194400-like n=1 Tax=Magnolia sinica TaxID=86752 RepID=UPI002657C8CB|nr:B3 domain-containing protein Os06g0194400-like [Magnolia sinica]